MVYLNQLAAGKAIRKHNKFLLEIQGVHKVLIQFQKFFMKSILNIS